MMLLTALLQEGQLGSRTDTVWSYGTWMALLVLAAVIMIAAARQSRPLR